MKESVGTSGSDSTVGLAEESTAWLNALGTVGSGVNSELTGSATSGSGRATKESVGSSGSDTTAELTAESTSDD